MENKDEEIIQKLANIESRLNELVDFVRLQNFPQLKQVLEIELDTSSKRIVFELVDGHRSQREIASQSGIAQKTVSNWLRRWQQSGIVVHNGMAQSKLRKIVSLEDIGISVPDNKDSKVEEDGNDDFSLDVDKLRAALNDKRVFPEPPDISKFAEPILEKEFSRVESRDHVIREVVAAFQNSSTQTEFVHSSTATAVKKRRESIPRVFRIMGTTDSRLISFARIVESPHKRTK